MKSIDDEIKYQPSRLFDAICKNCALKTDSELAVLLGIGNAQICKVRHGSQPLSGQLLLRIHEVTGIEIRQLKMLMGDRRSRQRPSRAKWTNGEAWRSNAARLAGKDGADACGGSGPDAPKSDVNSTLAQLKR